MLASHLAPNIEILNFPTCARTRSLIGATAWRTRQTWSTAWCCWTCTWEGALILQVVSKFTRSTMVSTANTVFWIIVLQTKIKPNISMAITFKFDKGISCIYWICHMLTKFSDQFNRFGVSTLKTQGSLKLRVTLFMAKSASTCTLGYWFLL